MSQKIVKLLVIIVANFLRFALNVDLSKELELMDLMSILTSQEHIFSRTVRFSIMISAHGAVCFHLFTYALNTCESFIK